MVTPAKLLHRCPHPIYNHGLVPNSSGIEQFGPTKTLYFVNSGGFRDGRIRFVDPLRQEPRILLMGDSFAEGVGVPWEETFAGRLAEDLTPRGIEVLNGAVASYCPSLVLARLRFLLKTEKYRVDLVVVFIDISDVEDELTYEAQPDGGYRSKEASGFANSEFWTRDKKAMDWLEAYLEKNFTLLGALSRNLRQMWRRMGSPGGTPELKRATWPDYRGPGEGLIAQGLDKARKSMDGVLALVKEHNTRLLVVIYPWLEQIDSGISPSRPETSWKQWCEVNSVPLVNFFPLFLPMGKDYEKKYCLKGDGHWNSEGHRKVAEVLLPHLEDIMQDKMDRTK